MPEFAKSQKPMYTHHVVLTSLFLWPPSPLVWSLRHPPPLHPPAREGSPRDAGNCSLPVGNNLHASELENRPAVGLHVGSTVHPGTAWLLAVHHKLGLR